MLLAKYRRLRARELGASWRKQAALIGLAQELRSMRERRRLSQADVASAAGVGQFCISRLENGVLRGLSDSAVERMLEAYDDLCAC